MSRKPLSPIRRVFVDTSAYFALLDRNDQRHHETRGIQNRLIRQRCQLFTTSFILAETHALLLARLTREIALASLRGMETSPTAVIWVTPADVKLATNIIDRYDDKTFSLTDATSFLVMERIEIRHAFTFDDHFSQYGLTVVTPDSS